MFYPATKLVITTEQFLAERVCKIIDESKAKGYTLVPAGGKGLRHSKQPTLKQASVVEGFDNVKIDVITLDRAIAEKIADRILEECFTDYPGVMYLEQVEVCRPERF